MAEPVCVTALLYAGGGFYGYFIYRAEKNRTIDKGF